MNITVKTIKQPNMFKENENKYYIQFISPNGSHVINVGEKTYERVSSLLYDIVVTEYVENKSKETDVPRGTIVELGEEKFAAEIKEEQAKAIEKSIKEKK